MAFSVSELPTLEDILSRKTLSPICLANFRTVMCDKLYMQDLLDFYLDVRQHEILWRRYVKNRLKSVALSDDLFTSYPPIAKYTDLADPEDPILKYTDISAVIVNGKPAMTMPREQEKEDYDQWCIHDHMPTREELAAFSYNIISVYLIPNAPKSLQWMLPPQQRQDVLSDYYGSTWRRHDPMLFSQVKYATFLYMERWAYPAFIRMKFWNNITTVHRIISVVIGLVVLMTGLTLGFSLILSGWPTWGTRCWVFLPLWVGWYQLFVAYSGVEPVLTLVFNISETALFRFDDVTQPEAKHVLRRKAWWILLQCSLTAVAMAIMLCVVPSTRLLAKM